MLKNFSHSLLRRSLHTSILETIGRTPIVNISGILPQCARKRGVVLFSKLEYFNPLGSVKDRLAYAIISAAEKEGKLKPNQTVVEATSGNTGIGLAFVCAKKKYPFVACMLESYSIDRRKIMRALGAKVVTLPSELGGFGMVEKAKELASIHGWFLARQFETKVNAAYHANTTGPEILRDFAHHRLDYFVSGYGTGGTFSGAGLMIKTARPHVKVVVGEPLEAPLIQSGIPQPRNSDGSPSAPHPAFQTHLVQGWTPSFIPQVTQDAVDTDIPDLVVPVSSEEAVETALNLAKTEGVFTGISGGGTVCIATKVAKDAPDNSVILAMVPDTQERYQNSVLWNSISESMTEEEKNILNSTPIGAKKKDNLIL